MSSSFYRGQQLGRNDLNIFLVNANNTPVNAYEISYALYDFTTGYEVLVGLPIMTPVNPSVGEYYVSVIVPLDANIGDYRIRWTFREVVGGSIQQVVQEFAVSDKAGLSTNSASMITGGALNASAIEYDLMGRLRILLRDNNPDRNYHFRPPSHEETVQQFSRVLATSGKTLSCRSTWHALWTPSLPRPHALRLDLLIKWWRIVLSGAHCF